MEVGTGADVRAVAWFSAHGPPTDWDELVQVHDARDIFQESPYDLPAIATHSR
jgi:hypothetical protein